MALSDVIVSFDLNQILGADYVPGGVSAYVKTNTLNARLEDTSTGEIRMGDQKVTIGSDGKGSWTTWAPGADGNPISWQEWLVVSHRSVGNKTGRNTQTFGPYTITGTSKTVTNKALTSNVATITTSEAHGLDVGNAVTIAGVDATFNGTFTITAVTSTTVSYAKTASNVSSVAATGTLTSPNVKLTSLEEEQAVPAEYLTEVTELLQGYVDQGEDLLAAQLLLSGISVPDSLVAGLISNNALGPLTRAALRTFIAGDIANPASAIGTALSASIGSLAGAGSDPWLKAVAGSFGFAFTSLTTTDATTGLATAAPVKWPDGKTGAFTGTVNADGYTGFVVTHVDGAVTKTVTATGITTDATTGLMLGPTGIAVA